MEAWLEALDDLTAGIPRTGVVHLGAHDGREVDEYRRLGFGRIILVEPLPARAEALRQLDDVEVVELAVSRTRGPLPLHVTAHDEASSLLRPIPWPTVDTIEVAALRLDDLDLWNVNVLVADVQGAEVDALSSGRLDRFDLIVAEATTEPRYEGGAYQDAVDRLLEHAGFTLAGRFPHYVEPWVVDSAYRR